MEPTGNTIQQQYHGVGFASQQPSIGERCHADQAGEFLLRAPAALLEPIESARNGLDHCAVQPSILDILLGRHVCNSSLPAMQERMTPPCPKSNNELLTPSQPPAGVVYGPGAWDFYLCSAGGFPRKHRSAGPIDVLEDLFDELLQERLNAFPVPARINVKLIPLFPGHPDIHLHQIPLEERVLIPGGRSTGFADPRRDR